MAVRDIPCGADYYSQREIIDGEETIIVAYDPDVLAHLAGGNCDVASYLCGLVLNEQMNPPAPKLRLVS